VSPDPRLCHPTGQARGEIWSNLRGEHHEGHEEHEGVRERNAKFHLRALRVLRGNSRSSLPTQFGSAGGCVTSLVCGTSLTLWGRFGKGVVFAFAATLLEAWGMSPTARAGCVSRRPPLCISAPLRLRVENPATQPRPPSCVISRRLCHANAFPAHKLAHRLRTPHSPSLRPRSIRLPCHYEAAPPSAKIL
jgi:hypothetical protein